MNTFPVPEFPVCCLPELLGRLVTLTAEHVCKPFKQRKDLPTHALTSRIHHLLLEMGISCQAMVLGSTHGLHHGCTKTESLQYLYEESLYPVHATPRITPCGVQTPKKLLMPEQALSQNDCSDPARFLLGKIPPHLGVGTCWSGLAKYLLAALWR